MSIISVKAKFTKVNEHLSVRLIQLNRQRSGEPMISSYVNQLRSVIDRLGILPYGETATFISFIQAKRSFAIRTNNAKHYLLTAYLTEPVSWIYEVRRSLGQDSCCARAHATSQGLPSINLERTYQEKYNTFSNANMLPCQKHFLENLDDPYKYIHSTIKKNTLRLDEKEVCETTKITYRLLISLISGDTPYSAKLSPADAKEVYDNEIMHMRITQLNDIGLIVNDCNDIITEIQLREDNIQEYNVDPVSLNAMRISAEGTISALSQIATAIEHGQASMENGGRLYKNTEVIKTLQRQTQSLQFSMFII